jgi:hypothetical protein
MLGVGRGAPQGKQKKGKGKAKAGNSAAGGGSSTMAAAGSSGEASTSRGEASRPSTLPSEGAGHRSTEGDATQAKLPVAAAASGTQQTGPKPAGGTKKEMQQQRIERQRQRRLQEAMEALQ